MSRKPSVCDGQQRACCVEESQTTINISSDARPAGDAGSSGVGICKRPTSIHIAVNDNKHQNAQKLAAAATWFQTVVLEPPRARTTCDTHLQSAFTSQCACIIPIVVGLVIDVEGTSSMRRSSARMLRQVPDRHQHQQRCAASRGCGERWCGDLSETVVNTHCGQHQQTPKKRKSWQWHQHHSKRYRRHQGHAQHATHTYILNPSHNVCVRFPPQSIVVG